MLLLKCILNDKVQMAFNNIFIMNMIGKKNQTSELGGLSDFSLNHKVQQSQHLWEPF